MIIVIGEVLMDMFPDHSVVGGAAFNVAFHLQKLGLPVRFLSRVGDDRHGRRIMSVLKTNGVDAANIQIDKRHPTGTVRVTLDAQGVPRFEICTDVAYDYIDLGKEVMRDTSAVEMVYFGSLVQRTARACQHLQAWLDGFSDRVTRYCDINLRPPHIHSGAVTGCLQRADLFKLSEEELIALQGIFKGPVDGDAWVFELMARYNLHAVALTRGRQGGSFYHCGSRRDVPAVGVPAMVDTVGAGDGFSAVLMAGYARQKPWPEVLRQASRFASRICSIPGAVPDGDDEYADLRQWFG